MCGGVGSIIAKGGSNVNPCVKPKLKRPLLGCRGGGGVGSGATGHFRHAQGRGSLSGPDCGNRALNTTANGTLRKTGYAPACSRPSPHRGRRRDRPGILCLVAARALMALAAHRVAWRQRRARPVLQGKIHHRVQNGPHHGEQGLRSEAWLRGFRHWAQCCGNSSQWPGKRRAGPAWSQGNGRAGIVNRWTSNAPGRPCHEVKPSAPDSRTRSAEHESVDITALSNHPIRPPNFDFLGEQLNEY